MKVYQGKTRQYNIEENPLAKGGEGAIYLVQDAPDLVAKIFNEKILNTHSTQKETKIISMLENPVDKEHIYQFTWPVDIIFENNKFCGYIMPKLKEGTKSMNQVFKASSNREVFEWFIHLGKNLCNAVDSLHKAGHLVGDFSANNIQVAPNGLVFLIDTDNFHINSLNSAKKTYPCIAGTPGYLPRELCGIDFSKETDTFSKESDYFALAVNLFSLLFNGSHPFACRVLSQDSEFVDRNENIEKGFLPYFYNEPKVTIPTYSPKLSLINEELQILFRDAFVKGHRNPMARPGPINYYRALVSLEEKLTVCDVNPEHHYHRDNTKCPWCEVNERFKKAQNVNIPLSPQVPNFNTAHKSQHITPQNQVQQPIQNKPVNTQLSPPPNLQYAYTNNVQTGSYSSNSSSQNHGSYQNTRKSFFDSTFGFMLTNTMIIGVFIYFMFTFFNPMILNLMKIPSDDWVYYLLMWGPTIITSIVGIWYLINCYFGQSFKLKNYLFSFLYSAGAFFGSIAGLLLFIAIVGAIIAIIIICVLLAGFAATSS